MAKTYYPSLLDKVFETVEKIGRKQTAALLDAGQQKYHEITSTKIEFVINKTCEYFNISKLELLNTRTKNQRTEALSMCYYIIFNKVKLNTTDIARYFDKDKSRVSRGIKYMRNLDMNHPFERKLRDQLVTLTDAYEKEFVD